MSFTFDTFYIIYKRLYTDIVPPQKTKSANAPNFLSFPIFNYTTRPPRIVEQIVNILPPTPTPYLPTPPPNPN